MKEARISAVDPTDAETFRVVLECPPRTKGANVLGVMTLSVEARILRTYERFRGWLAKSKGLNVAHPFRGCPESWERAWGGFAK